VFEADNKLRWETLKEGKQSFQSKEIVVEKLFIQSCIAASRSVVERLCHGY